MTLTEFLLARLAEDEAVARKHVGTGFFRYERELYPDGRPGGRIGYWLEDWQGTGFIDVTEHIARHDPARVLADVEAKRRIIQAHETQLLGDDPNAWIVESEVLLRILASVHSTHPDFDAAWRA